MARARDLPHEADRRRRASRVVATVHPSSILRAPDDESRRAEMRAFVRDLRAVTKLVG
jgi:DNA polymerase